MIYFELPEDIITWNELLDGSQEDFDQYFFDDTNLHIYFHGVDIIESSLFKLANKLRLNTNLNKLTLKRVSGVGENVDITVHVGQAIANILILNNITSLVLSQMINTVNIVPIIGSLENNTSLQVLDLCRNNISDSGTILLAQILETHTSLRELDLRQNNISAAGTTAIAQLLQKNSTIYKLDLGFNDIVEGIVHITEALHHNYTLTILKLCDVDLNMTGIQAIADMLMINTGLIHLDLSTNDIGDEGANIIAQGLSRNSTLIGLDLLFVNMGDKSLINLSQVLSHNSSLTCLGLGDYFKDEGLQAMGECLKINSTLRTICMLGDKKTKDGLESLSEGLKYNSTLTDVTINGYEIEDGNLIDEIEARCELNQFNQNINSKTLRDILLEYKNKII